MPTPPIPTGELASAELASAEPNSNPPRSKAMGGACLNLDVGELPDEPEDFYRQAHLVHVACGGHAGDEASMVRAIRAALEWGPELGAHPSYPDRANFGRRSMTLMPALLGQALRAQLEAFAAIARRLECPIVSVKAHGALYHDVANSAELAEVFLDTVVATLGNAIRIVGPPDSYLHHATKSRGLLFWPEGFADRGKAPDGSILPRTHPRALITDLKQVVSEALALRRTRKYRTLCLHGDTPGALALARAVRRALDAADAADSGDTADAADTAEAEGLK